jgi:hypothetical protein
MGSKSDSIAAPRGLNRRRRRGLISTDACSAGSGWAGAALLAALDCSPWLREHEFVNAATARTTAAPLR